MSQELPTGGFMWVTDIQMSNQNSVTYSSTPGKTVTLEDKIRSYNSEENKKGYILEVSLFEKFFCFLSLY